MAVVLGLSVDVPGDGPGLGSDAARRQTGGAHRLLCRARGRGGRGLCTGTKQLAREGRQAVRSCGKRHRQGPGVEVGVGREVPPPGVQDPGEPREVGPEAALVCGEPLAGHCRGVPQGLGREALRRADAGTQGLRDGAGAGGSAARERLVPGVLEPRRGVCGGHWGPWRVPQAG